MFTLPIAPYTTRPLFRLADPSFDRPWIIHECCTPGCGAIQVKRDRGIAGITEVLVFVPEVETRQKEQT